MQPAIINGHNLRMTAPDGHPDVQTLFVRQEVEAGVAMLRSAWECEQGEIGLLLAGAKVLLGIAVPIHPVVRIDVADLPEEFEPVFTARRYQHHEKGWVARIEAVVPSPPHGLRLWVERPIVAGFPAAFEAGMEAIVQLAREKGVNL